MTGILVGLVGEELHSLARGRGGSNTRLTFRFSRFRTFFSTMASAASSVLDWLAAPFSCGFVITEGIFRRHTTGMANSASLSRLQLCTCGLAQLHRQMALSSASKMEFSRKLELPNRRQFITIINHPRDVIISI